MNHILSPHGAVYYAKKPNFLNVPVWLGMYVTVGNESK